jgi:hypothetical protein
MAEQNGIDTVPINRLVAFFHIFKAAVMFHRTGKREIGKTQILLHLFVAHTILLMVDFIEIMAQKDLISK